MNPVKNILVQYRKARGIYDLNTLYKRKYNPSNKKEILRMEKRLNKINRYDDEETGEPPIEQLSNNKARLMYKMFNEMQNFHRHTRKEMPKEVKAEFIKKSKEFSLFKTNQWRHQRHEMVNCLKREGEMMKSACFLPMDLCEEIMDVEGVYEEDDSVPKDFDIEEELLEDKRDRKKGLQYKSGGEDEEVFKENSPNIVSIEYSPEFLYLPQLLRIYPDDYHIIFKTFLNLEAYEETKHDTAAGEGDTFIDDKEKNEID
jgi:hypothetical protein